MKSSLAKNAIYNMIYQLLNVVFPLISVSYASRILAPEGMGRVAYAQNVVSYFVMFAVLGIPSYGIREIARCADNPRERSKVFSELILLMGISTFICSAVYGMVGHVLLPDEAVLYWIAGTELLFCFVSIDWLYQGMEEFGYIITRNILVKIFSLLALFAFVKDSSDYVIYALIHCLGIGVNQLFNVVKSRKWVKFTTESLNLHRHLLPVLWLMVSSIAASLYLKVDVTMLGLMTSPESVAYYSNASKVIAIVLGMVTAFSAVFLPRLSYVFETDKQKFSGYLSIGLKVILLLAIPAYVGISLVSDNLIRCLFGEEFLPGGSVIRILAVLLLIKGVGDLLCYQVMISTGNERELIKSRVIAGVANIVLNYFLIPKYRHVGAAVASVISEMIVNGMLIKKALAVADIQMDKKHVFSVISGTVVMGCAVWLIQNRCGTDAVSLIISVAAGVLIYCGMLLLMKNPVTLELLEKWKQKQRKQEGK